MTIRKIVVGPIYKANCYIVRDPISNSCVIIDPGDEPEKILDFIKEYELKPEAIIITHSHPDHVGALEAIKKFTTCDVVNLTEGEIIKLGDIELKAIETRGHTSDSFCIVCEQEKIIFTGDTLFRHSIGRTDLPGGDKEQMEKSLRRLMELPDDYKIYPGHGPETTIGEERTNNPFLKPEY
ncbi:MAG: MBL fold metallo-hydrolase [Candidatus Tagabacteria bacterium CG09_land_8_20_14_0_10_41_14]|uniref:MBL fold metallo-hydrolase n=2 Tax=Candidatus Tagaibacteriota TaxID=1817918 RepID=A0A2H0WM65_9BACT|nr:MAG: MBL fold metallo-hydrolase [Candidatus Tagabacteria bacterium CG09_land_8_20_14_0_10_41_14]PJE72978.1 MAG: MBL fold metallo-hydrolase [Candidatus Tagabacteria bacterium CG10_big_fil_rev_8_21_14_0_10_40_13]